MLQTTTMTYSEILEKSPNLITVQIDDNLKQLIFDWFQFRNVCDDDKFGVFFNRELNKDYGRYLELLRVQARTDKNEIRYDWLVGNYTERETTTDGTTSTTTNGKSSSTTEGTTTGSRTDGGKDTSTHTGNTKTDGSTNDTKTTTSTDGGKDTTETSGSSTENTTNNQSTKNNQSHQTDQTGSPNTVNSHFTSGTAAAKNGPMDAAVTSQGTVQVSEKTGSIKTLDVDFGAHASSISQNYGEDKQLEQQTLDTHTTESYSGDADTVDTTGKKTGSTSGSTGTTYGKTNTTKDSSEGTSGSTTTNNLTDTTSYGRTEETSGNNNVKVNGTNDQTQSGSNSSTYHERYTGRTEAPADIMERAIRYIEGTSAWQWLYRQLDTCFISVYDI